MHEQSTSHITIGLILDHPLILEMDRPEQGELAIKLAGYSTAELDEKLASLNDQ